MKKIFPLCLVLLFLSGCGTRHIHSRMLFGDDASDVVFSGVEKVGVFIISSDKLTKNTDLYYEELKESLGGKYQVLRLERRLLEEIGIKPKSIAKKYELPYKQIKKIQSLCNSSNVDALLTISLKRNREKLGYSESSFTMLYREYVIGVLLFYRPDELKTYSARTEYWSSNCKIHKGYGVSDKVEFLPWQPELEAQVLFTALCRKLLRSLPTPRKTTWQTRGNTVWSSRSTTFVTRYSTTVGVSPSSGHSDIVYKCWE